MNLQIKVDAANSNATIANVERGLAKTEDQAKKTQQACDALGGTFKRIADHERFLAGETRKAQQAVDSLGGSFSAIAKHQIGQTLANTAKAFDGLTEAIHREQKMLESIHGPMQKHMQDLQTLDALQRKGAISAEQHANALARSRSKNGVANPLDAVSLQTPSKSGGGGMFAGAGSLATLQTGAAALVAKEVFDLSDSYTNLENRLRQVSSSQSELNSLMEKTRGVADASRSDWSATGEAFVRVSKATRDLGLSQSEVLDLTLTMNKAIKMSGATGSEATAGMLQLTQALQSGVLAGDEFKSVNENLGSVMDVIAQKLGVPRGQLKELAAQGKITSQVIVEAFQSQAAAIDESFGKTIPTASDQWALLKNQATETAGEFVRTSDIMSKLGGVVDGVSTIMSVFGKVTSGVKDVIEALGPVGDALTFALEAMTNPLGVAKRGFEALGKSVVETTILAPPLSDAIADWTKRLTDMHKALSEGLIVSVQDFADRMSKLHADLSKPLPPAAWVNGAFGGQALLMGGATGAFGAAGPTNDQKDLEDRIKAAKAAKHGRVGAHQMTSDELEAMLGLKGLIDVSKSAQYLSDQSGKAQSVLLDLQKEFDAVAKEHAKDLADQAKAQEEINKKARDYILHLDEIDQAWRKWALASDDVGARIGATLENLNDEAMANLKQSAFDFGDALVDSIFEADFSWKKFMDNMARDLLKQTVHGGIDLLGAALAPTKGGRTGFDAMVPAGMGPFLPGFRTGGDMLVGGSGAPDSKIAAFRVSPGETLHVRTPEQRRAAAGGSDQSHVVNVYVPGNGNGVISEREIEGVVVRVIEKNRDVIGPRLR